MTTEYAPAAPLACVSGDELPARIRRMRALSSAWSALSDESYEDEQAEITDSGRTLSAYLNRIAESRSDVMPAALKNLDTLIDEFETSVRASTLERPIASLRTALPAALERDRQSLLDLLDVLIGADAFGRSDISPRIPAIDYLVTLLCTCGETGTISHDPVTLTRSMARLCTESDEAPDDPRQIEIESEFFTAANMDAAALRREIARRTLRQRKLTLGSIYFAPRVLRAIVTYNAALMTRVPGELPEVMAPDVSPTHPLMPFPIETRSVFESKALRQIAAAARRRVEGGLKGSSLADRIVAALDFDSLESHEFKALSNSRLATADDPLGTAILVGLLGRSASVLSMDLQELGLTPDTVSVDWPSELRELFQQEIHWHLAHDAYSVACRLSELKSRFLLVRGEASGSANEAEPEVNPERSAKASGAERTAANHRNAENAVDAKAQAEEIMRAALEWHSHGGRPPLDHEASKRSSAARLGAIALATIALLLVVIGEATMR
jgi:hypothetical protein